MKCFTFAYLAVKQKLMRLGFSVVCVMMLLLYLQVTVYISLLTVVVCLMKS